MTTLKQLMLEPSTLTLAVAESLTCGRVQAKIGAISGASGFFLGGLTAYTLTQKVRLLRVDASHAASVDCVSERVAEEMARGVCALYGSDIGLATTGYAEADPGKKIAAPMAWWALCHRRQDGPEFMLSCQIERPDLARVAMQEVVAEAVLAALEHYLKSLGR